MTSMPVESPRRGDNMRASWGARVAERVNECADAIDVLRGPGSLDSMRGDAASAGVAPFTVRYDTEEEVWLIYLPLGCVNVGGTCHPINLQPPQSQQGQQPPKPDWYLLAIDEQHGTTGTDADGNTYREWTVTAHAKTSAKMWQVDDLNAPARRLLFVGAEDSLKNNPSDAERYRDTPGDAFSCAVARIRLTTVEDGEETRTVRKVTRLRTTPVDVGGMPAPTGFDLVWYLSVDDDGGLAVEHVYCVRQMASLAGISATGDTMTDVTDAEWIYAKIETADLSNGNGIVEVVTDPGNDANNSAGTLTWLALLRMKENTVVEDHRENSLKNVQVYRA